jgi:hypothetical protein
MIPLYKRPLFIGVSLLIIVMILSYYYYSIHRQAGLVPNDPDQATMGDGTKVD